MMSYATRIKQMHAMYWGFQTDDYGKQRSLAQWLHSSKSFWLKPNFTIAKTFFTSFTFKEHNKSAPLYTKRFPYLCTRWQINSLLTMWWDYLRFTKKHFIWTQKDLTATAWHNEEGRSELHPHLTKRLKRNVELKHLTIADCTKRGRLSCCFPKQRQTLSFLIRSHPKLRWCIFIGWFWDFFQFNRIFSISMFSS